MRLRFLDEIARDRQLSGSSTGNFENFKENLYGFEIINYIAGLAHLVWFIVILSLAEKNGNRVVNELFLNWKDANGTCPESTAFFETDGGKRLLEDERVHTHSLSLKWLVLSFHLLSFLFEYLNTDPFWCRRFSWSPCKRSGKSERYRLLGGRSDFFQTTKRALSQIGEEGVNPTRFAEYSASASVMLIAIALVNGIDDSYTLIGIGFLSFTTMVFGGIAEQLFVDFRDENTNKSMRRIGWIAHLAGWVSMLAAYGIILRSYFFSNARSQNSAPDFVTPIVLSTAVFYLVFGVVQLAQLCLKARGKSEEGIPGLNEKIETAYVVLSLVSKSVLGALISWNVLSMEQEKC